MAFFRSVSSEQFSVIDGKVVTLRVPEMTDFTAWAELRAKSREFLVPWEPIWPSDDLERSAFRRRLKRYGEEQRADQSYAFLVFRRADNVLVGGITVANVRRGVAQTAAIGYWMGAPFARQGYMTEAVRTLAPYAFDHLRLHRLEAACIPTNAASIALLEKTGFRREGYAREYLCINGAWADHFLYARLRSDGR